MNYSRELKSGKPDFFFLNVRVLILNGGLSLLQRLPYNLQQDNKSFKQNKWC